MTNLGILGGALKLIRVITEQKNDFGFRTSITFKEKR